MRRIRYILAVILSVHTFQIYGQIDSIRPEPPVLNLATVNQLTGNVELYWQSGPSPDVSGYVIYLYTNNEGYALDTITNPLITSFIRSGSGTSFYSEAFVVAAVDTAGNISPLSNELNTIYTEARFDTCNRQIDIIWNTYPSLPVKVLNYSVFFSAGGNQFAELSQVEADKLNFLFTDFDLNVQYCFIVRANLENGLFSGSNTACLLTRMQKPPQWINARYATTGPGNTISLSFEIDPQSEITSYVLERMTGATDIFREIRQFSTTADSISFTDTEADPLRVNYYRLAALNNCGTPVIYSNIASNIVLSLNRQENKDEIELRWNPYTEWTGGVSSYKLFVNPGGNTGVNYEEKATISSDDTIFISRYSDFMNEVTGTEICFMIKAYEASNPYSEPGVSSSSVVCIPATENVTVPNTFTPDGNLINDYFRPVMSFTPSGYHLLITDLRRKVLFETRDHEDEWDGMFNGIRVPEGVYLWFLKVGTPAGKTISLTGTVTVIDNR